MTVSSYTRKNNFKTRLYTALVALLIIGILYTLANKKTDYTILQFIIYIVVEIFLNPKTIKIDNSELIIVKQYLGGLLKKEDYIEICKINKIFSVGLDISNDSATETGTGIIWWGNGDSEKPFDLYQIEYTNKTNGKSVVKINMFINECDMLKEKLRTTTALQKLGCRISPFDFRNSEPAAVIWLQLIGLIVTKQATEYVRSAFAKPWPL